MNKHGQIVEAKKAAPHSLLDMLDEISANVDNQIIDSILFGDKDIFSIVVEKFMAAVKKRDSKMYGFEPKEVDIKKFVRSYLDLLKDEAGDLYDKNYETVVIMAEPLRNSAEKHLRSKFDFSDNE